MPTLSRQALKAALLAGGGAMLCITILAALDRIQDSSLWLMAPFGASMVILFGLPDSPLAQPKNIFFGHVLTTLVGLSVLSCLGVSPLTLGLGVGLALTLMMLTGTLHPPAGANPLLVMLTAPGWGFVLDPVACGALLILAVGWVYHNLICGHAYPLSRARKKAKVSPESRIEASVSEPNT
ncbi:HPP family protein [Shewanella salipaludis]|uniref:HPP family protein n=1 Tax=Shewanella salipaludis TaxID=2723052 RepID=A0A972FZS2_9GAMM|nr:HPP family protein [Shewanella salipaludis]NMH65687.1 HPP family protein [Shewanella salipaludis]